MSSTIPPLLSSTPPPIDFDNDDDFGGSDGNDSTFCQYDDDASLPTTPEHNPKQNEAILPVQSMTYLDDVHSNVNVDEEFKKTVGSPIEICESSETKDTLSTLQPVETADVSVGNSKEPSRCNSPPSLQLAPEKYSDNECDTVNDDELDEYHEPSENVKSEDSHSLPSLNLDSIRNSPVKNDESDENVIDDTVDTETNVPPNECVVENVQEINEANEYSADAIAHCKNTTENQKNSSFAFDADFSQFNTFESDSNKIENKKEAQIEVQPNQKGDNDDDDDFGDFAEANTIEPKASEENSKNNENIIEDDNDDDDDFGDFNDFQQQRSIPQSELRSATIENESSTITPIDLDSIKETCKSIIISVFSSGEKTTTETSNEMDVSRNLCLSNNVTEILKDFENSKASRHQWNHSAGKNCLIKSLGIDCRNILYGEKWKSPMPRFAANLGYNPLEPLKPGTSQNQINIASNKTKGTTSNEPILAEVPAAQFDWNSSGLVNPLDASQAHTLLLDLDQLVVMDNLDKIKIDYSSYTCTSKSSLSSTTSTTISSKNVTNCGNNNSNGGTIIDESTMLQIIQMQIVRNQQLWSSKNNNNNNIKHVVMGNYSKMDKNIDSVSRSKEIIHNADNTEDRPTRIQSDQQKSLENIVDNKNVSITMESSHKSLEIETSLGTSHNESQSTQEPLDPMSLAEFQTVSASYTAPGSTLKETHIFTPVKNTTNVTPWTQEKSTMECPDYDLEKAAVGVIIKENVVKKEYRDIEYDPNKLTKTTSDVDEFSDFQSVAHTSPIDTFSSILQPVKTPLNVTIDWPNAGTGSNDMLEDFTSYAPRNEIIQPTAIDPVSRESNDKLYSTFNKPTIGVSPSERMFDNQQQTISPNDDDFSDFQSTKTVGIGYIPQISAISDIISTCQETSKASDNNSQDSSLCSQNNHVIQPSVALNPTNILVPQVASQPLPTLDSIIDKPQIDWPDPGISDDLLARIEAIFPQPKSTAPSSSNEMNENKPTVANSNDEDEWSDFVSVAQPQLPITHILSQNLHKHQNNDEDDWTDFVSSSQNNYSSGPNFTAWNAPSTTFHQWQSKAPIGPQMQSFDLKSSPIRSNGHNHMQNNQNGGISNESQNYGLPSIISLPDLGFVAPKTLVNMPKMNPSKK